jgi:hypothetical protein
MQDTFERSPKPKGYLFLVVRHRPRHSRHEIAVFSLKTPEPQGLLRFNQVRLCLLGQVEKVKGVPPSQLFGLPAIARINFRQLLQGILAYRLEHYETALLPVCCPHHQALCE